MHWLINQSIKVTMVVWGGMLQRVACWQTRRCRQLPGWGGGCWTEVFSRQCLSQSFQPRSLRWHRREGRRQSGKFRYQKQVQIICCSCCCCYVAKNLVKFCYVSILITFLAISCSCSHNSKVTLSSLKFMRVIVIKCLTDFRKILNDVSWW